MKFEIEIPVFTSFSYCWGHIHGEIDLPAVPGIGETVAFANPPNGWEPEFQVEFPIRLTVAEIIHHIDSSDMIVTIFFEPMDLESEDSTKNLKKYFKKGFGLSVEKFRSDDESVGRTEMDHNDDESHCSLDLFDRLWVSLWLLVSVIRPTWEFYQDDPALNFGQCMVAAALFLVMFGLPLAAWLMSKLRAPIRRLLGLTTAKASENYQI